MVLVAVTHSEYREVPEDLDDGGTLSDGLDGEIDACEPRNQRSHLPWIPSFGRDWQLKKLWSGTENATSAPRVRPVGRSLQV